MDNTVEEKSKLVIDALAYAHNHNLDINDKNDVEKILDVLDPQHLENVEEFVELLRSADTFIEITAKEKEPKKEDLPN